MLLLGKMLHQTVSFQLQKYQNLVTIGTITIFFFLSFTQIDDFFTVLGKTQLLCLLASKSLFVATDEKYGVFCF